MQLILARMLPLDHTHLKRIFKQYVFSTFHQINKMLKCSKFILHSNLNTIACSDAGNRLLGSYAVYFWLEPTFRRNVSPPSSGQVDRDEIIRAGVCKSWSLLIYSHRVSPAVKMAAIRSSETSVLTKNTRRKISEDGFLHSHRHENLKSYKCSDVCITTELLFPDHFEYYPNHWIAECCCSRLFL
jgi:hypothetical protein